MSVEAPVLSDGRRSGSRALAPLLSACHGPIQEGSRRCAPLLPGLVVYPAITGSVRVIHSASTHSARCCRTRLLTGSIGSLREALLASMEQEPEGSPRAGDQAENSLTECAFVSQSGDARCTRSERCGDSSVRPIRVLRCSQKSREPLGIVSRNRYQAVAARHAVDDHKPRRR
jgi:hypothetical protein